MSALSCAVCLYVESPEPAAEAVTVIEGYAVCDDHLGLVAQGERFAWIIRNAAAPPGPLSDAGEGE